MTGFVTAELTPAARPHPDDFLPNSHHTHRQRRLALQCDRELSGRGGFSVIEVVTVVAIICLIAALLLPALSCAKAKSRRAVCLNNLKQLQLAWQIYAEDHSDLICPNKSEVFTTGRGPAAWTDPGAWRASPGSWVVGNPQWDSSPSLLEQGVLYPFTKSLGVYHCPADQSRTRTAPNLIRNRSYALDIFLNGTTPIWGTVRTRLAQIEALTPSKIFGFIDVLEPVVNGCDFGVSRDRSWYDLPAEHHDQGVNLSFLDGHLEAHPWRFSRAKRSIGCEVVNPDDLKDLRWLQERLPSP